MKKRFFLAPLALSIAALLPVASNATTPATEKPSIVSTAIAGLANTAASDLVIEPAAGLEMQMAHVSHSSHVSHASHSSHASHVSHYSGS